MILALVLGTLTLALVIWLSRPRPHCPLVPDALTLAREDADQARILAGRLPPGPCRLCGAAAGHWSGCLLSRRGPDVDAADLLRQLGTEG